MVTVRIESCKLPFGMESLMMVADDDKKFGYLTVSLSAPVMNTIAI